ncbi:MAG: beta-glucosidase BglX [Candidatus Eremiobacteraeota bacterium]|nr:beta-glucosidase BglX [Candidatus Eremiobacteraeota bacterium]
MKRTAIILALVFTLMLSSHAAAGNAPPLYKTIFQRAGNNTGAKIEALLKEMTLEEKIGQMSLLACGCEVAVSGKKVSYKDEIRAGKAGALFGAYTAEKTRSLQRIAVEETRLGIPLLFGFDVLHGHRTIFPIPLAESCSWDLEQMERDARIAATEASAEGLHWTFAPMVDIARDPRWGRIAEGAGEDPWLACQIARARVRGFQGRDLSADDSLLACAKHYAAYGAAEGGRDYNTVDVSLRALRSIYLPPFRAAVAEGAATVMTAFNEFDGVPCTGNSFLIKEILKEKWHFTGFVVSDYAAINEMVNHGTAATERDASEEAVNAGVDMDMQSSAYRAFLEGLVKENRVSMETIDRAVARILTAKFRKGLFDDPYRFSSEKRQKEHVLRDSFAIEARRAAAKSMVLLKNDKALLPLAKGVKTIALTGPLADDRPALLGGWSAAGRGEDAVSIREGMGKRFKGTALLYAKGCSIEGESREGFAEALAMARRADVIVACMGESAAMSGEAASRASLDLPGVQRDFLMELKKTGKPIVLVLINGRPLTVAWEASHTDAMLEAWFPGIQGGNAIADVLSGDVNPSGKLTVTFPRSLGQIPLAYDGKNTGRPFDPFNRYTSKYLDMPTTPLFPFGYGLSYTEFRYSPVTLSSDELHLDDVLTVSVTVKNMGRFDGEEIVQLYLRDLVGSVTRPLKELRGFRKVLIPAGRERPVTFTLSAEDLAFYRRDMSYGAEEGQFEVFVGPHSQEGEGACFTLKGSATFPE